MLTKISTSRKISILISRDLMECEDLWSGKKNLNLLNVFLQKKSLSSERGILLSSSSISACCIDSCYVTFCFDHTATFNHYRIADDPISGKGARVFRAKFVDEAFDVFVW